MYGYLTIYVFAWYFNHYFRGFMSNIRFSVMLYINHIIYMGLLPIRFYRHYSNFNHGNYNPWSCDVAFFTNINVILCENCHYQLYILTMVIINHVILCTIIAYEFYILTAVIINYVVLWGTIAFIKLHFCLWLLCIV